MCDILGFKLYSQMTFESRNPKGTKCHAVVRGAVGVIV